jgi:7,8-dihydropterin-6-yl-methyl-4-(beta-D-ribofuranosyl)aminobenzene 5'-phosphate synthase
VTKLTSCDRLHAVVGGFHLGAPRFEPLIGPTCEAFPELVPGFLVPAHRTGWKTTHALAARFPEAFLRNSVGTRFEFEGTDERA